VQFPVCHLYCGPTTFGFLQATVKTSLLWLRHLTLSSPADTYPIQLGRARYGRQNMVASSYAVESSVYVRRSNCSDPNLVLGSFIRFRTQSGDESDQSHKIYLQKKRKDAPNSIHEINGSGRKLVRSAY
jgi:hypothetical protein